MKRILVTLALGLTLAACGGEPEQVDLPKDLGFESVYDNGRHFRCVTQWKIRGYGGGLAMWCYEENTNK